MTLEHTLKALYESEISFRISAIYDGGIEVAIGGNVTSNGGGAWWVRENNFRPEEFDKINQWLIDTAIQLYPESEFAKGFKD